MFSFVYREMRAGVIRLWESIIQNKEKILKNETSEAIKKVGQETKNSSVLPEFIRWEHPKNLGRVFYANEVFEGDHFCGRFSKTHWLIWRKEYLSAFFLVLRSFDKKNRILYFYFSSLAAATVSIICFSNDTTFTSSNLLRILPLGPTQPSKQ